MAAPPNVELEAAKFLHKLIQESKDEPTKLARKLCVILQHMRSSGKENSMPYQVISRAMETVVNQHGLDIEALKSSRLPLTGGTHMGDSSSTQFAGSSQTAAIAKDSKTGMAEHEVANSHASSRPPAGPSGVGHDIYQGSVSHFSTKPLDHGSPSSFETRSANSQSQERHDSANWEKTNQNDGKKASGKRKRPDLSSTTEPHIDNSQQLDTCNLNARKGKLVNKLEPPGSLSVKGASGKVHGAVPGAAGSYAPIEPGISSPMHFSGVSYDDHGAVAKKTKERSKEAFSAKPSVEPSAGKPAVDSEYWKHGFVKGTVVTSTSERIGEGQFFSASRGESGLGSSTVSTGKAFEHDGGTTNASANANKIFQGGLPGNIAEMNVLRGSSPRDSGKSITSQAPGVSNMPFKEQHLKQLRAQCLVFLAFRSGMMPKKLHLEIALGNFLPKEDGPRKELIDHKGKELSINDPSNIHEETMPFGRLNNIREEEIVPRGPSSSGIQSIHPEANLSKESEDPNMMGIKNHMPSDLSIQTEERMHLLVTRRKGEAEALNQEIAESQAFLNKGSQPDSLSVRGLAVNNRKDDWENGQAAGIANQASSVIGMNKQNKPEMISWTGIGSHNEAAKGVVPHELVPERKDSAPSHSQFLAADCNVQGNQHADSHLPSFPSREHWKSVSGMVAEHQTVIPVKDAYVLTKKTSEGLKHVSEDKKIAEIQRGCTPDGCKTVLVDDMLKNGNLAETDQEEEDSLCIDLPPSPKHTTSEKWIMERQRRKLLIEQNWALKQQKTQRKIAACSDKLKETVSSSEDISAKTKSVIELKKLQLLELQLRLRSDILNDFFKPIATEMDRLKSIKKHRIGRRSKQIERFEQKMKEERQKRVRERQKEFFSEIEVHRERLDDVFKIKRERWKGFNKYVREFHKRKERIHREKIDRIQREKINLLKINDVEGYLRMVQDAKSDRVKQLLKETEKYLQKLGSKLKEAKAVSRHFETDIDENRGASVVEDNEFVLENEDEADQAKHYLESNEKYYLMAHSIKESIMEQPTGLIGGKLREYQMNGLRWLVSLYNNHLNGILADEMGLGKTVQVIALICYLMETKNDRGPFLVVVPSSVLPGWDSELNFWAPGVSRIVYSGPPEERRRLFKERIVSQKFNVLLTTYEYLMNKHDRPKLSKLHWHYIIIDEGHRIKNASCKLNADLKHYRSSHRLLLTGTPLQNNLEELWALLNFLLPNIFNSSEDFSQWFNKPFESNGDNSADEALLSEEENLLIINRLHQVLRPFVLRRLKHKVENQLPEKIERLVRCEASAYQKLLMKRVEDNLGAIGSSKARSVHNSVMELRNICNHPYLSQLHSEEVHDYVPQHFLPNIVRLCGKLEMLDRLLPKLKATDHRVLFFSTMTRLLDVMEDYLCWKQYRYLRLDGHTSGGDRGALIDKFNQPGSPFFIFLLSIRAGGVGVNLQAADTVIIFDTDWNPQVDLQAQARAHRIGQKKEVLVLRLETVQTVEEQVRASAEHKLGVANQSITAGFFDNNTSAEDRREYLESLLRECKKEEAAPVLDDDSLNDLIARSESEIDIFESVDKERKEDEMEKWKKMLIGTGKNISEPIPPLPSRLLTDDELKLFYEAIKIYEVSNARAVSNVGAKRKGEHIGGLDTQHYGRGKRAREVRSYEEQWTEEEFEKMCQADSPDSPKLKEELIERNSAMVASGSITVTVKTESQSPAAAAAPALAAAASALAAAASAPAPVAAPAPAPAPAAAAPPLVSPQPFLEPPMQQSKEVTVTPPSKRGRGRPKRSTVEISPTVVTPPAPLGASKIDMVSQRGTETSFPAAPSSDSLPSSATEKAVTGTIHQFGVWIAPSSESIPPVPYVSPGAQSTPTPSPSVVMQVKVQTRKTRGGSEAPRRRGKNQALLPPAVPVFPAPSVTGKTDIILQGEPISSFPTASCPDSVSGSATVKGVSSEQGLISPAVPVLLPSSETGKLNLGSEVQPVSCNPMVPGPDSFPATSVMTGISGLHQFGVGIAPSSQPNPPLTSDVLGSQSLTPTISMLKQPKARGRKPQSGVEAPRRRGRKPGSVASVAAIGVAGQDPKLSEQPQSNVQLSSGRKSIGTRRKKQNEATELTNVVQVQASEVQTSVGLDGLDAKPAGQSDYSAQNKQHKDSSTKSDNAFISVDKIDSLTEKIDGKAQEMKMHVMKEDLSTESDNAAICLDKIDSLTHKIDANTQKMKTPVMEEALVSHSKVAETESLEEEIKISTLGTAAAGVLDPEFQKTQKDVSVETQKRNDLILQEAVVSKPEVCELETKLDSGSFVNVEDSSKLVEENSMVETKVEDTSAVPVNAKPMDNMPSEIPTVADASISDFAMDTCEDQSAKEDAKEKKMNHPILDHTVVSEPRETESLGELKFSTLSTLETTAPVVDPEIEKNKIAEAQKSDDSILQEAVVSKPEACEPETKLIAGSFENLADSRDLVKFNSMAGTHVDGSSLVTLTDDPLDDVPCEKPPVPDASVLEGAASVLDLMMGCVEQSGKKDPKEQEMRDPVLGDLVVSEPGETKRLEKKKLSILSTLETATPVVDPENEETWMEVDGEAHDSVDPVLLDAVVRKSEACEPESKTDGDSFVTVTDGRDDVKENSIVGANVEGTSAVLINADLLDDLPYEKSSAPDVSILEITMDKGRNNAKEDAKEQKLKGPVAADKEVVPELRVAESKSMEGSECSTLPTLEKAAPVVDPEIEKTRNEFNAEAPESNGPFLEQGGVSKPKALEPETKLEGGSLANATDLGDVVIENALVGTIGEGTLSLPLDVDPSENVPCEKPPTSDPSVLEAAASTLKLTTGVCEDQSGKEVTKEEERNLIAMDKELVSEPVVTENQSLECTSSTLVKASPIVDPCCEKPDTQLNVNTT